LEKRKLHIVITLCLFFLGCSAVVTQKEQPTQHWNEHPQLVLSLSRAIVDGMRALMDELLISELWFEEMDVSVYSNRHELLRVRIIDFALQDSLPTALHTSWRIKQLSRAEYDYVTTDTFAVRSTPASDIPTDSLFLQIGESTSRVRATNGALPESIRLIYWRDISSRDKVAALQMRIESQGRYSRKY